MEFNKLPKPLLEKKQTRQAAAMVPVKVGTPPVVAPKVKEPGLPWLPGLKVGNYPKSAAFPLSEVKAALNR
jgi:hypothetical protein